MKRVKLNNGMTAVVVAAIIVVRHQSAILNLKSAIEKDA
jgi:hypothetical protein